MALEGQRWTLWWQMHVFGKAVASYAQGEYAMDVHGLVWQFNTMDSMGPGNIGMIEYERMMNRYCVDEQIAAA